MSELPHLDDLPKVHPRREITDRAVRELPRFLASHELTPSEVFWILSDEIRHLAQTCIQTERYNTPGGLPRGGPADD